MAGKCDGRRGRSNGGTSVVWCNVELCTVCKYIGMRYCRTRYFNYETIMDSCRCSRMNVPGPVERKPCEKNVLARKVFVIGGR